MTSQPTITKNIKALKCCVIIPTYNNDKTLRRVIAGVLKYTDDIIIVNDGATDSTAAILKEYPLLQQIHFPQNKGKGSALRAGFKLAGTLGHDFAITIDSDGQHYPDDIPAFITALQNETDKNVLLIGDRNMTQEGIPKKSSFGNKFSSFWYRIETGIQLRDTQSGYRLYPLKAINGQRYFTSKFEFEIEVIVRAAWNGVTVKNIPIRVLYDEAERVSHFRPYKDFIRISILNTCLVFLTFAYFKPRDYFLRFKKKGFKRFLLEDFLKSSDSKSKKSLSIALGVFIGIAPFWGFQTFLAISLARLLGLNKVISFAFSNVSIPPFIPIIIFGSLKIGALAIGRNEVLHLYEIEPDYDVGTHILQYVVGSFLLATLMALLFGAIGYLLLHIFTGKSVKTSDG